MALADWAWVDWSIVLWGDESRFTLFQNNGREFVRRRAHETYGNSCVVPTVKLSGGGVTLWGAISYRETGFLTPLKGNLKNGYLDILRNSAIPSAHLLEYGDNFVFQDDVAPCHRANVVKQWKSDQNMCCLECPPQSPDLNHIENLQRDLGKAIRSARCHNLNELQQALVNEWS